METIKSEALEYAKMQRSPIYFAKKMWGLEPQPILPEYEARWKLGQYLDGDDWKDFTKKVKPTWFGGFIRGKHLTWQQTVILLCLEKAVAGKASKKLSIVSGRGIGKAISNDSLIPLSIGGFKKMGELTVGDKVFGSDGKPTNITGVYPQGERQIYSVEFSNGVTVEADGEHIWTVKKRSGRDDLNMTTLELKEWLEHVDEVNSKHDRVVTNKPSIKFARPVEYKKRALPIHPYVLGVLIGDGCLTNGPSFTNSEDDIVERMRSFGYEIHLHDTSDTHKSYRIQNLTQQLLSTGLSNHSANSKFIPEDYLYSSVEDRIAILQGLCDTDGYVINPHTIEYSTVSEQLSKDLIQLVRSLGGSATTSVKEEPVYIYKGERLVGQKCYRVWIQFSNEVVPVSSKKHLKKYTGKAQRNRIYIEKITESKIGETTCITVDAKDSLFLCNDFIVTHNSSILAIIILWFLFCFPRSLIPCTAVTATQLNDALWKELAMWIEKLKSKNPAYAEKFEWSSSFVRMKELPGQWYARAKTASKDRPEALSGVHAENIMSIIDESSAVDEKVFEMGDGIFTSGNAFTIMISNGTRSEGRFYRSHHGNSGEYQNLSFSSMDSPVVNDEFVKTIVDEYCKGVEPKDYLTVTEYRVNLAGLFPIEGVMDDKGYVPLLSEKDIRMEHIDDMTDRLFVGHRIMGIDPAGSGHDKTVWVIRDRIRLVVVHTEAISTPPGIAAKTITLCEQYGIAVTDFRNIVIDAFGVGHNVSQEIALMTQGKGRVFPINTGETCDDPTEREVYSNKRAEAYWKLRQWVQMGGVIDTSDVLKKDLLSIRYRRSGAKIQIEPKLDMKKRGLNSPDQGDAASLCFLVPLKLPMTDLEKRRYDAEKSDFDPGTTVE